MGGTEAFAWRMADLIQRENWMEKKTWMIVFHGNNLGVSFDEIILGILIGVVLLAVSKVTGGAVGMGDGLLFTITGIYFGFRKNLILLLGSLVPVSYTHLVPSGDNGAYGSGNSASGSPESDKRSN